MNLFFIYICLPKASTRSLFSWTVPLYKIYLAKILGLPTSKDGGIEGKDVAQAFKDGRIKEICAYCKRDVELTRKIYKRMVFEE